MYVIKMVNIDTGDTVVGPTEFENWAAAANIASKMQKGFNELDAGVQVSVIEKK